MTRLGGDARRDTASGAEELIEGGSASREGKAERIPVAVRVLAGLIAASVAVYISVASQRGSSRGHRSLPPSRPAASPAEPHDAMPHGAQPLPGFDATGRNSTNVGLLAVLMPTHAMISRRQALLAYDRMPVTPRAAGDEVRTAVARIAYTLDGVTAHQTVWIVSVWRRDPSASGSQWCVSYGYIEAFTGESRGHDHTCGSPAGDLRPTGVSAGPGH